jgi:hypothetical protein
MSGIRGFFLLREAEEDQTEETVEEPMEDEADMDSDDDEADDMDSDLDGDMDDDGDGLDGDDAMDDSGSDLSDEEKVDLVGEDTKKYKLMLEYEKLLETAGDMKETMIAVDSTGLKGVQLETFKTLENEINENIRKLEFVMANSFSQFKYERLLTIYLYIKTSIKVISEILKKIRFQ